ncbi:hypothetical protein Tmar_0320 [Thermaerobacter marianensis DSM 12885]|uniref:NERD domain-containing protein n=1 Tax=Thermaerobacter marianensis (strain ATCC 700841 / DSM 12885 / JCM 10246 / 7p75a) TaxID=644966 RepID=E6SMI5_THEM7|nr:hypothetical protein [Thermaerobacter marianensis]ADU50445.1 hypothetical protein Tmar_0320 [Thermaerobacter marianensis DSM 12885]
MPVPLQPIDGVKRGLAEIMTSPNPDASQPALHQGPPASGWVGPPPAPPRFPWNWAVACVLLGWGAGSLFRLRRLLGINILDMFGFWCLVGAGLCAARFFTLMQVADGRRRLLDALERLPGGLVKLVLPPTPHRGRGGAELLVAGENRAWVVATLDVSAAARPKAARKHLVRAAERLAADTQTLVSELAAAGIRWTVAPQPVLVLTRRPVPGPVLEHGAWQVNPEHVAKLFEGRTEGAQAGSSLREALLAWQRARLEGTSHRSGPAGGRAGGSAGRTRR